MKTQKRLDKVLESVRENVQEEVGALMGVNFTLSEFFNQTISKEDYFSELTGKKIVAKIDVTGEIEGDGGLVISVKDAIRLGGTLIMLPQAELEDVVKNESYTEETEDSYGEIANIIAGAYTKMFEEMYPENCRFVRKEQVMVSPLKVEIADDEPVPDIWYYLVRANMTLDGHELGDLDFLLPAESFGLEIPVQNESSAETGDEAGSINETINSGEASDVTEEIVAEKKQSHSEETPSDVQDIPAGKTQPVLSSDELEKHKKIIKKVLTQCNETVSQEVSALLGVDLKLSNHDTKIINKEEFFLEETSGKQVLAHMDVVGGEEDGKSFLFVSLKDAIRIGAILIMLPPAELETAVNEEDFTADSEDAYGEIANIISGVYTTVFQNQYKESYRFIKKELETVTPMRVDIETDDVIPCESYFMSSCQISIDGKECSNICMLFPSDLLGLSQDGQADAQGADGANVTPESGKTLQASNDQRENLNSAQNKNGSEAATGPYDVLIIENNSTEVEKIQIELARTGMSVRRISFNDSIKLHINENLKLIIIVMKEVNEQAYGVTIKVNSLSSIPIIAAGPDWTRSKVIKAVKYGVHDILLTPADPDDIMEKIHTNIMDLAA